MNDEILKNTSRMNGDATEGGVVEESQTDTPQQYTHDAIPSDKPPVTPSSASFSKSNDVDAMTPAVRWDGATCLFTARRIC